MSKIFKEVNGTSYSVKTKDEVVRVLETCRLDKTRITVDYGDVKTGKSWGEVYDITGRIARSSGEVKVPILLHNKRSHGGGAMLDDCIIGIKESKGGKVLYSQSNK